MKLVQGHMSTNRQRDKEDSYLCSRFMLLRNTMVRVPDPKEMLNKKG